MIRVYYTCEQAAPATLDLLRQPRYGRRMPRVKDVEEAVKNTTQVALTKRSLLALFPCSVPNTHSLFAGLRPTF